MDNYYYSTCCVKREVNNLNPNRFGSVHITKWSLAAYGVGIYEHREQDKARKIGSKRFRFQ